MISIKPKLEGNDYANIVTVFAVIIAIEYSTGSYDAWDFLIGIIAIMLGCSFSNEAKKHNDFLFSFLTAGLISLGIISILSVILFANSGFKEPASEETAFYYEIVRVVVFLAFNYLIQLFCINTLAPTKST